MPSAAPAIGSLRKLVSLWEDRGEVRAEHQQPQPRWVQVAEFKASIEPISGREFFQAQQVASTVTHRIRCRYRPGVNNRQQIRWQGRTFHLTAVLNIEERDEWLEIMAVEHLDGNA